MPQSQVPCPEERARYGNDVEVGEVIVRDLESRGIIEQPVDGRTLSFVLRWWVDLST